ncbi:MAG: response regulator [Proteobacteria bacterium]|nr:response regulator [Pseudomonadota bacterium]MBU1738708.1 response regulator [Pseudomonadota bacterium]
MNKTKVRTILIVDDDVDILNIASECLEHLGHKILVAENGVEALEVARKNGEPIDLLLTDVIMPKMNGVELAENLIEKSSSTKVIFMSGYLRPSMNGGQTIPDYEKGFVMKPFSGKTLSSHVKEVLEEN